MAKTKKNFKIDGKSETGNAPATLDQIWGDTGMSKYKTLDESVYAASLEEFNKSDLQAHAIKIGLIPVDNRQILTQRLIREFRKHTASYKRPSGINVDTKVDKKISQILSEGR